MFRVFRGHAAESDKDRWWSGFEKADQSRWRLPLRVAVEEPVTRCAHPVAPATRVLEHGLAESIQQQLARTVELGEGLACGERSEAQHLAPSGIDRRTEHAPDHPSPGGEEQRIQRVSECQSQRPDGQIDALSVG